MKFNKLIMSFSTLVILSFGLLLSCEDDSAGDNLLSGDYVSIETAPKRIGLESGASGVVEVKVFASKASSSARTLQLEVAGTATSDQFSAPSSVTIPAGATEASFDVNVTESNLGFGGKTIIFSLVPQEGINIAMTHSGSQAEGTFATAVANRLTITAREVCPEGLNPLSILIVTDQYGAETDWELYDASFNVIATGGPYANQGANAAYPQPVVIQCLSDGNYTFVIYDAYGDGMNSGYGAGYYRLTKTIDDIDTVIAQNGVFGQFDIVEFSMP